MVQVVVSKKCAERLLSGHLWVFNNEIKAIKGDYSNGDIVHVADGKTRFIGKGYINDNSKIIIRLLSFRNEEIDKGLFRKRIEDALSYRLSLGCHPSQAEDGSFRVVFSEGVWVYYSLSKDNFYLPLLKCLRELRRDIKVLNDDIKKTCKGKGL